MVDPPASLCMQQHVNVANTSSSPSTQCLRVLSFGQTSMTLFQDADVCAIQVAKLKGVTKAGALPL